MKSAIQTAIDRAVTGNNLTTDEMHAAVSELMDGQATEIQMAALLTSLKVKGETVDEIVGAARAMKERVTAIPSNKTGLLDTCGTGGDELYTFNISTATAIVAAAAGVSVAKHGNRSVSSSSGSADVLEALGVNVQLSPTDVGRCIDILGIGFCFAPLLHGAMKHAAPVRKQLGFRTIFNLLGPLTNPARAEYQLIGVNTLPAAEKLAGALAQLGGKRALVVCGAGELDEVSLWGETTVFEVENGSVTTKTWTAETFGLSPCYVENLRVDSADESAAVIRNIFAGKPGAPRDIVLANAAAALIVAQHCEDIPSAVKKAAEAIDSGQAAKLCGDLANQTKTAL